MNDLDRVLQALMDLSGDREVARDWLQRPLRAFADRTPMQLIAAGEAERLVRYLASLESGFVG